MASNLAFLNVVAFRELFLEVVFLGFRIFTLLWRFFDSTPVADGKTGTIVSCYVYHCALISCDNLTNATFGAWLCMVLKLGGFGQQIKNTWKVLKCGAGEGWRRSVRPIM